MGLFAYRRRADQHREERASVDIELLASREDLSEFDRRLIDILMPGGATSRRVYKKYTESFANRKEIRKALIGDIKEKNWWNKPLRAWNKRTSIIARVSAASLVGCYSSSTQ